MSTTTSGFIEDKARCNLDVTRSPKTCGPYSFARNMLITSSDVITPVSRLCAFTTGRV